MTIFTSTRTLAMILATSAIAGCTKPQETAQAATVQSTTPIAQGTSRTNVYGTGPADPARATQDTVPQPPFSGPYTILGARNVEYGIVAAVGDLNGDGYPDLVTSGTGQGTLYLENNKQGAFKEGQVLLPPAYAKAITQIHLVDFNDDGKLDILLTDTRGVVYWSNNIRQERLVDILKKP